MKGKKNELLTRSEFKNKVFERQKGKCAFCDKKCVDAHHILERKLFEDGGYYLDNGIGVCSEHHLMLEKDEITVEEAREVIGIENKILPKGFDENCVYDKWGNKFISNFEREKGPLFNDDGCKKALKMKLWMFL